MWGMDGWMAGLEKSVLATSLRCIMVENRVDRGLIHRDRPRLIRKSFDKGVPCPVGGERGEGCGYYWACVVVALEPVNCLRKLEPINCCCLITFLAYLQYRGGSSGA